MIQPYGIQNHHFVNGHDSGTDWLEAPAIYKAYIQAM